MNKKLYQGETSLQRSFSWLCLKYKLTKIAKKQHRVKISLESNNAGSFKLQTGKDVPFFNFSLVPQSSPLKLSKINCFGQCLRNEFCSFAVFKNGICSLHTEYALTRLVNNPSLSVVYKKEFIINHCSNTPCMNGATCVNKLDEYVCLCDLGYFGKKKKIVLSCDKSINNYYCETGYYRLNETDVCKPCMSGFTTFNNYPFNCYKKEYTQRDYETANSYCQGLNSFLWTPKTRTERNIFASNRAWVNSKITYVGEPFVWPDGLRVYEMGDGEPNNGGGNNYLLHENANIS
ncbi:neurocan core -like [Brachionus plicatilis]|uniref:Neurocan core-like n=1 Tax=Brachionus plicatilis TaxID=10195 RepID=A0A3M7RSX0_BRAPC|nr:neurocan core -like [Brachionus plicatilis]